MTAATWDGRQLFVTATLKTGLDVLKDSVTVQPPRAIIDQLTRFRSKSAGARVLTSKKTRRRKKTRPRTTTPAAS